MRTPEEIVKELAPSYKEWKGGEKSKEKLKREFFEAITEHLRENGEPAEDYIIVTATNEQEATEMAERQRPGWSVDEIRKSPDVEDAYEVIVIENPEFMPYTVEFDGQVWGRQIAEGDTLLDEERLQSDDEELWIRITSYPYEDLLRDIAYEAGIDHHEVDEYIETQCERHGVKRSLKAMDEIADEDLARLQEYMYSGKPKVKLPAPKKVKG